jgi:hypothetical protein
MENDSNPELIFLTQTEASNILQLRVTAAELSIASNAAYTPEDFLKFLLTGSFKPKEN